MEIEHLSTRISALENKIEEIARHVGLGVEKVAEEIAKEIKELVEPAPDASQADANPDPAETQPEA